MEPPPESALTPALTALIDCASDDGALELARSMLSQGQATQVARQLDRALGSLALDPAARRRLQRMAAVVADEAESYEQAARLWRHAGEFFARSEPGSACHAFVRAFAYTPEDGDTALEGLREVVSERGTIFADGPIYWLRELVKDGLLPLSALARVDEVVSGADPRVIRDPLYAEFEEMHADRIDARVKELVGAGEFSRIRRFLPEVIRRHPPPEWPGGRLLMMLSSCDRLLGPGADRGEVRYLLALYDSNSGAVKFRACLAALADLAADDPRALDLARRVLAAGPGKAPTRADAMESLRACGLPPSIEAALLAWMPAG